MKPLNIVFFFSSFLPRAQRCDLEVGQRQRILLTQRSKLQTNEDRLSCNPWQKSLAQYLIKD